MLLGKLAQPLHQLARQDEGHLLLLAFFCIHTSIIPEKPANVKPVYGITSLTPCLKAGDCGCVLFKPVKRVELRPPRPAGHV